MSQNPFQHTQPTYQDEYPYGPPSWPHRHSIVRTVVTWAAIALIAMTAFGLAAWAFGLIFHLAVLLIKVVLVTAVVALVWRRITGRRHRNYEG
ncbi:MAG: hypothetical protein M0Z30_10215 [Actinomycetota bacterium]|nr:hypothetical protein [Actinomycetota bacterium]